MRLTILLFKLALLGALLFSTVEAQTTGFTYQGRLTDMSIPANGSYDFQFALFNNDGTQVTPFAIRPNVTVTNGIFTVDLDFGGSLFPGDNRFLQIAVKRPADPSYTPLSPRQPITSAPYAIKAINAETAVNSARLGGVESDQFIQTSDPRLSDNRNPTSGSNFYIRNGSGQQTQASFNISGTGTASAVNTNQINNLNGNRLFTTAVGSANTFAGIASGASATTGSDNSYFGFSAGSDTTTGGFNSFFGAGSGSNNTTGGRNSFFGRLAGLNNITGSNNTLLGFGTNVGNADLNFATAIGSEAVVSTSNTIVLGRPADTVHVPGSLNVAGTQTSAIYNATTQYNIAGNRVLSSPGSFNTFVGAATGSAWTTGSANSFFGNAAGFLNSSGNSNTFIGDAAGSANTTGSNNTIVGAGANLGSSTLSFATAIGAGSIVTSNNTIVLGRNSGADAVRIPGAASANSVNSATHYAIGGARVLSIPGSFNTFVGFGTGEANTTGSRNTFVGSSAGSANTSGSFNVFLGAGAGERNVDGAENAIVGPGAGNENTNGSANSFFGHFSGRNNVGGDFNSYFGHLAGHDNNFGNNNSMFGASAGSNTTSSNNAFFGYHAGIATVDGGANTFLGTYAGELNTSGTSNTFLGFRAGNANTTGSTLTLLGSNSDVTVANLTHATAIGAEATVSTSNTVVLGRSNGGDKVRIPGLGVAGATPLCRNASNEISTCSGGVVFDLQQKIDEQQRRIETQQVLINALVELVCKRDPQAGLCMTPGEKRDEN